MKGDFFAATFCVRRFRAAAEANYSTEKRSDEIKVDLLDTLCGRTASMCYTN